MAKKKKGKNGYFFIAILFIVGLGILFYPAISNLFNKYRNSLLVEKYEKKVKKISNKERDQMYEEAIKYNKNHLVNKVDGNKEESLEYKKLLSGGIGDGIMGTITIPKIKEQLPIYHGLSDEVLEKGCGHVEGTSLPVGGKSTHGVYAAHRGLPGARLFTDLDKIKKGDKIYFFVLGRRLAYKVDQIKVVLPEDSRFLQIEEGKDMVTLVTCTPYAINTHRLLVRGSRVKCIDKKIIHEEKVVKKDLTIKIVLAGFITAVMIFICILVKKKKGGD